MTNTVIETLENRTLLSATDLSGGSAPLSTRQDGTSVNFYQAKLGANTSGGMQVALGDGSVRFVSSSVSHSIWY